MKNHVFDWENDDFLKMWVWHEKLFFLCFAALQNARFCLCFERKKSVENARFPKKHKKQKKQNSTEFCSARRRFIRMFGKHFW